MRTAIAVVLLACFQADEGKVLDVSKKGESEFVEGSLRYRFTSVFGPAQGKGQGFSVRFLIKNVSEKENVDVTAWQKRFKGATLTDDRGREYVIGGTEGGPAGAKGKIPPGVEDSYFLRIAGHPNPKAKELRLILPKSDAGEKLTLRIPLKLFKVTPY